MEVFVVVFYSKIHTVNVLHELFPYNIMNIGDHITIIGDLGKMNLIESLTELIKVQAICKWILARPSELYHRLQYIQTYR